jgi:hypothetical protein
MWPFTKKGKDEVENAEFRMVDSDESGSYTTQVVGESFYQINLDKICRGKTEEGQTKKIKAILYCDDSNEHDINAVRIDIDGLTVGHLSRADAISHRNTLIEQNVPKIPVRCSGLICGGWSRERGRDTGSYGVTLDLPTVNQTLGAEKSNESEFTFSVVQPSMTARLNLEDIGDSVKLWSPRDTQKPIIIYRQGSVGGEGRLGFVPDNFVGLIANQLASGLPLETEIIEVSDTAYTIRCKLISADDIQRAKESQKGKIRAELIKPYRPRKPVVFVVDAKECELSIGEQLKLISIPSVNECANDINGLALIFTSIDGEKTIEMRVDTQIKIKLIRLMQTFDHVNFEVVSKSNERPWYTSEYKLQGVPVDPNATNLAEN